MGKTAEWIEDLLGASKETKDPQAIKMIECCGKGCALRKNDLPTWKISGKQRPIVKRALIMQLF